MQEVINKTIELNSSIFGEIKSIQKINVGFTNTIYNINDRFITKLDILSESMNKGNRLIDKLPGFSAICHNDMDSKNVMWR